MVDPMWTLIRQNPFSPRMDSVRGRWAKRKWKFEVDPVGTVRHSDWNDSPEMVGVFEDPPRPSIRPSSKSLPGYLRLTDSLPR